MHKISSQIYNNCLFSFCKLHFFAIFQRKWFFIDQNKKRKNIIFSWKKKFFHFFNSNYIEWSYCSRGLWIFLFFVHCFNKNLFQTSYNGFFSLKNIACRYQHFTYKFFVQIFRTNVVLAVFSSYVLALAKNLYEKHTHIMLMKLTKGHDFWHTR